MPMTHMSENELPLGTHFLPRSSRLQSPLRAQFNPGQTEAVLPSSMRVFCMLVALATTALSSANLLQNDYADPHEVRDHAATHQEVQRSMTVSNAAGVPMRRLGVGNRHPWSKNDEGTMAPHMKSVIESDKGKTKKESKGNSKSDERAGGKGKRARPVTDEMDDVEEGKDGKDKGAQSTNNTRVKKSKDKNEDSNSSDKDKQKDKLSKPTPTPSAYPTSVDSASPSSVPSGTIPGARPVFEEPTFSPVNVSTLAPVVAPVATTDAPVLAPATVPDAPVVVPVAAVPVVADQTATAVPFAATLSPTGAPNINIVAASEQIRFTGTVTTKPLYLRVDGDFDPVEEEGDFFTVLEEMFSPYSRAYISYILNEFDIAVLFLNALTQMTAKADGSTLATSWCEVNVTFQLASENEDDVAGFTADRASQFVKRFFMDSHKTRLINRMAETGVAVNDLEVLEQLPDDLNATLLGTGAAQSDERSPPIDAEVDDSDLSRSSYAVAFASGGVIFLALGAMALLHRQQKDRVSNIHGRSALISGDENGLHDNNGKALAFVSGSRRGAVRPAALHMRNRRERERQRAMSSNNTVSTYFTTETALSNSSKSDAPKGKNRGSPSATTSGDMDSSTTGTRLTDLAVSSALTCLDGEESVGALNEAYPEFEMYQSNGSPPPSPVWSIDNYSNTSPYSVEEDYVAERRRWHDEANELALIALPDTNSVYSMSQHSRSDQSHVEERNTRHRMDEV